MSKKWFNFGAGWIKERDGKPFISCKANDKANDKGNVRIQAVNENGETVDIDSFVVFYNDKEKDNHPDVRFSFSIED